MWFSVIYLSCCIYLFFCLSLYSISNEQYTFAQHFFPKTTITLTLLHLFLLLLLLFIINNIQLLFIIKILLHNIIFIYMYILYFNVVLAFVLKLIYYIIYFKKEIYFFLSFSILYYSWHYHIIVICCCCCWSFSHFHTGSLLNDSHSNISTFIHIHGETILYLLTYLLTKRFFLLLFFNVLHIIHTKGSTDRQERH